MKEIDICNLSELGDKWLKSKIKRMQNLLKIAEPDEALYREIMLSLGYPKNKTNFLELALLFPYKEIKKLKEKAVIEKALLYRAGLIGDKEGIPDNFDFSLRMDKSVWFYKGTRPANFPQKRIKGISQLLAKSIDEGLVAFFTKNIQSQIGNKNLKLALRNIMNFAGIGIQRKEEMFFNIIMPFMTVFSKDENIAVFLKDIFENYPPLRDNLLIKAFKTKYRNVKLKTVREYMGALFREKNYQDNPFDIPK